MTSVFWSSKLNSILHIDKSLVSFQRTSDQPVKMILFLRRSNFFQKIIVTLVKASVQEKKPKMDPKNRFFFLSKIPHSFELLKQVSECSHQTCHFVLRQFCPKVPSRAVWVHPSSRSLKWPNLVSKRPVKIPRWPIYHYYGFDCTELHLLSIDSIAASLLENIWLPHSSQYQRTK